MNSFDYLKVSSAEAALAAINENNEAKFIAGGTNLIDLWKYNLVQPSLLVDLNKLDNYKKITSLEDGGIRIGALMSNAETAYHPIISAQYPLLSRAILAGASAQIRNSATNGGNLMQRTRCYYFYDEHSPCNKRNPGSGCPARSGYNRMHAIIGASEDCVAVFPSDMCVALSALDAIVNVYGPNGVRQIPFSQFHRLPGDRPESDNNLYDGELITSINLPAEGFNTNYSYLKLRDRHSYAFALVSVASAFEMDGDLIKRARIALGGVAHKPWRSEEAEHLLIGRKADAEAFANAAAILLAEAEGLKYNHFKIELAKRAIIRNGLMALDPNTQRPGAQPSN